MSMKVIFPGALSSIQDRGRIGYQKYGITSSGAMDSWSMAAANALVGNDPGEAVLEMTVVGPILTFTRKAVAAIAGAPMTPTLNQKPVPMHTAFEVNPGDLLSLGGVTAGCRTYLTVRGGFAIEPVMGSRSTNLKCALGGFQGRALKAGDEIPFREAGALSGKFPTLPGIACDSDISLRVVPGPQEEFFTENGRRTFYSAAYRVSDSADRMGYKLAGAPVENTGTVDIISDGIVFGSVQIPPNGMPIVMMADHQTTGGYAKIGTVISCDLPKIAQTKPGDTIHFVPVTVEEAQNLQKEYLKKLQELPLFTGGIHS
ncbi:MAG: biotin-dependent carboxyltransferase family protein [Candidatus Limivivens sp.]|nr:biotin-dependent carboxyltransferase family protein [Candidatus Limivivens sp.]